MKLAMFSHDGLEGIFGIVLNDKIYPVAEMQKSFEVSGTIYSDIKIYLAELPESFDTLKEFHHRIEERDDDIKSYNIEDVKLLSPVPEPAALIDFGLSPRHLMQSAKTMFKYELNPLLRGIASLIVKRKLKKMAESKILSYFKCNHNAVIGHNDTVFWPPYTSYLDIEPELAIVTGPGNYIAGYTIFNDSSARDVQMPEMTGGGPARSKDFNSSKGVGPFLLTPDEIPDPLALNVKVEIGERFIWKGTTSEYSSSPEEVVEFMNSVFTTLPGTVIGMGTIPDCAGMDNDLWILPGEKITITFDSLGTLVQNISEEIGPLEKSRWKKRGELEKYYPKI
jgi:2-keto-4-pentenoate hydratase/2-oxohepta-3-ene-1,7-dioic acid hydratase in catechol pathway